MKTENKDKPIKFDKPDPEAYSKLARFIINGGEPMKTKNSVKQVTVRHNGAIHSTIASFQRTDGTARVYELKSVSRAERLNNALDNMGSYVSFTNFYQYSVAVGYKFPT